MSNSIVVGNRRFRCLSPTLVRIQFAPDGRFENRRSIVAYQKQDPIEFEDVREDGPWTVLDTGFMEVYTKENERACDRTNLEIRWTDGRMMQCWRPGDRDHQNLGGTLRSLDRYNEKATQLEGVDVAGMEAPDPRSTVWPAWLQCEEVPHYSDAHPDPPDHVNRGHWLRQASSDHNRGRIMHRLYNRYQEALRFCPGVLSRSGYFFLNDSGSAVMDEDDFPVERDRPGSQDWYMFAYADDYRQAMRDFRRLSGPAPLPPHRSLGIMFSRWPAFDREEIDELHTRFEESGYPLSVLIMDMEWHRFGWGHWDFNTDLIPDPTAFFQWCHAHDLDVFFNDHPLDVREDDSHYEEYLDRADAHHKVRDITYGDRNRAPSTDAAAPVDITDKRENQAFRAVCHEPILEAGLDYWWNDGTRGGMSHTCGQLVGNKTFYEETEDEDQRGMLLSRYGGLGSHRYGAFFTGDTKTCYEMLRLQCEFNIRSGHVGLNYVSHDIGGFMAGKKQHERIDPRLYVRWLQFGVFNPILRFHSSPWGGSRRPWDYDEDGDGACERWLRVRHSLLPYLNTANHTCYETGLPVVRGMFLDEPRNDDAYRYDQFYFGPDILVAPVMNPDDQREVYLPDGQWWEFESRERHEGGGTINRRFALDEMPVYVAAGSVIPRRDPAGELHAPHIDPLILDVYGGASGEGQLREDDGRSPAYKNGHYGTTRFTIRDRPESLTLNVSPTEGQAFGSRRALRVNFYADFQPSVITCDGEETEGEEKDGALSIHLPAVRVEDGCSVTARKHSGGRTG